MFKWHGKIIYTKQEVLKRISNKSCVQIQTGQVCKFYMSYDDKPDWFEKRWGVFAPNNDGSYTVMAIEGTTKKHSNYIQVELDDWNTNQEGFTKKTYLRIDQKIILPSNCIISVKGMLTDHDLQKVINAMNNIDITVRNNI